MSRAVLKWHKYARSSSHSRGHDGCTTAQKSLNTRYSLPLHIPSLFFPSSSFTHYVQSFSSLQDQSREKPGWSQDASCIPIGYPSLHDDGQEKEAAAERSIHSAAAGFSYLGPTLYPTSPYRPGHTRAGWLPLRSFLPLPRIPWTQIHSVWPSSATQHV